MYIYIDSIHCSNNVNCIDTKISSDNFEGNSAVEGAVIYKIGGTLEISQSRITDNVANKGVLFVTGVSSSLCTSLTPKYNYKEL